MLFRPLFYFTNYSIKPRRSTVTTTSTGNYAGVMQLSSTIAVFILGLLGNIIPFYFQQPPPCSQPGLDTIISPQEYCNFIYPCVYRTDR